MKSEYIVSEYARIHNVSVQTIYRKIKSAKQMNSESLTEKRNGKTYITEKGDSVLTQMLGNVKQGDGNIFNVVRQGNEEVFNNVEQVESAEVVYLHEQIKHLHDEIAKEREYSRNQAERLADLAQQLAELSKNNQVLLGMMQKPKKEDFQKKRKKTKKSLLERIVGRKM
jgi:hypothetical protein